ncbi:MAG: hypothetical protein IPK19_34140 [Chloroflexi bacterium]|nr:hypothetical protein [Chloroflexota bacterium]
MGVPAEGPASILTFAAFAGIMREKSMNLRKLLPGIIILLALVSACSPPPPLRDDKMLLDESLVSNEPCTAPCWNGITPGETSWRDALTTIEDDPNLNDPTTRDTDDEAFPDAVVAEFQRPEGSACCQLISLDGETVSTVFVRLAPGVTVGEVIGNFGEPAYLAVSPYSDDPPQALANLVYPNVATVIYVFLAGATSGEISEESDVIGALYITSQDMDDLLLNSSLHVWEGYNTYQYYDQGEFEITPQPTPTATVASP